MKKTKRKLCCKCPVGKEIIFCGCNCHKKKISICGCNRKELKFDEAGAYEEVTREELIERLIDDDINIIYSGDMNDYLYYILNDGFCGYKKYPNNDLIRNYYDRIDPDLSKPNVKIVKIKKERK